MRYLKISIILFLSTLISCGYFFSKKHKIVINCNSSMIRKIIPPEHTYKCTIYKTGACNPKSRLYILIDGKRYMELDVREKGNVFWQDWYGNEFGLEYIPCPDQVGSFDEGDMKVFVTFNY